MVGHSNSEPWDVVFGCQEFDGLPNGEFPSGGFANAEVDGPPLGPFFVGFGLWG